MTAAAKFAIFSGLAWAASTPYMAAAYTLASMTLALASAVAGQYRSFLSCCIAFPHLLSRVLLQVALAEVRWAPRYLKSWITSMPLSMRFHRVVLSHPRAFLQLAKL